MNDRRGSWSHARITGSAAAYRYERRVDVSVQSIERELGTRLLVTGAIRARSGHLVVSAQLNDSMSHREPWAVTYDREAPEVGSLAVVRTPNAFAGTSMVLAC